MPQSADFEMDSVVRRQNEVFLFREPIVLLTMICLSLLHSMTIVVQSTWITVEISSWILETYSLSVTAVPIIGMVFFAFLSEVHGRKPIFITLFTLSIFSNILLSLPWQNLLNFSFLFQGLLRGGARTMITLSITEYCSPKHRLTYMLVNIAGINIVVSLTNLLFDFKPTPYPYVLTFQIVLGLVCLASAIKWPESPYWLASKGKLEESRKAFFWLRGAEARKELNSVIEEKRSPGPIKLYWMSFFVAMATISVDIFIGLGERFWQRWVITKIDFKDTEVENIIQSCSAIVIVSIIAVVSYYVKRKVLFLLVSGISILFSYGIALSMHLYPTLDEPSNQLFYYAFFACKTFSRYGPEALSLVLSVEIIPWKYNTHMACVMLFANYIVYFPFMTFFWRSFVPFEMSHAYIPLFTTLSLIGTVAYGYLAPETKGKTLLEIQKMYTPEQKERNPKEEQHIMTHI